MPTYDDSYPRMSQTPPQQLGTIIQHFEAIRFGDPTFWNLFLRTDANGNIGLGGAAVAAHRLAVYGSIAVGSLLRAFIRQSAGGDAEVGGAAGAVSLDLVVDGATRVQRLASDGSTTFYGDTFRSGAETGYAGFLFRANVAGERRGVAIQFRHRRAAVPTVSLSGFTLTNVSTIDVAHVTVYGFMLMLTATAVGEASAVGGQYTTSA